MESNNLIGHVGRETETTAPLTGKTYRFSRWDRQVWLDFAAFARKFLPRPVDALAESIDLIALKDAAIFRQLLIDDAKEKDKAEAENRPPVYLSQRWAPMHDKLISIAADKQCSYLAFNSKEFLSVVSSLPG